MIFRITSSDYDGKVWYVNTKNEKAALRLIKEFAKSNYDNGENWDFFVDESYLSDRNKIVEERDL